MKRSITFLKSEYTPLLCLTLGH